MSVECTWNINNEMKFVSLFRLIHHSSFYLFFIPPLLHSVIVCACEYLSPTFSILLRRVIYLSVPGYIYVDIS